MRRIDERGEAWKRKIPISYFPISKGYGTYGDPTCRVPTCSRERVREWAITSALKLAAFKRASEGGSGRGDRRHEGAILSFRVH